jgi:hypothetical protein
MKVSNRSKEIGQLPELAVDVYLLKIGLPQPLWIGLVRAVGTKNQLRVVFHHALSSDQGSLVSVLSEMKLVRPPGFTTLGCGLHLENNIRLPPGSKTANFGKPLALANRFLQPATDRDDIVEKSKNVEEVRLASGVRSDEQHTTLQSCLDSNKVAPVTKTDSTKPELLTGYSASGISSHQLLPRHPRACDFDYAPVRAASHESTRKNCDASS